MSPLGARFEGPMESRTGQGESGVILVTHPLSVPSSQPRERAVEEEGIRVSGAIGRWWDSQILILPKHTSHAKEEGHEASDVCGGAADEPITEREYAAGGRGPGLKAVIPAVSHFQISPRLSAPKSVCSDSNTRRGPFTSWDRIDLV